MKLKQIGLKNFRQFYGEQIIELAQDDKRNITLIHGHNGAGKTTILNSLLWTFFNDVTKKFEHKDDIITYDAFGEGARSGAVDIRFEHDGTEYVVQRTHRVIDGKKAQQAFSILRAKPDGAYQALLAPETFINTVIPREMAPYFFFDGEQAETFSSETNYKLVGQAIRNILGCNLVERALDDLEYVSRALDREIGNIPGEEDLKKIEHLIAVIDDGTDNLKEKIKRLRDEKESVQEQIEKIEAKLRDAEQAANIQRQRDDKVQQLKTLNQRIQETRASIISWLGSKSIALVASRLTKDTLDFIDEQSLKGKIPSPYNEEFVQGLLNDETCVCHRPIPNGSPEWNAVASLLKDAANAEIMGRVVRARARSDMLKEVREEAPHILMGYQKELGALLNQRRALEQQIEELGKQIEGLPIAEIVEREQARKALITRVGQINNDLGKESLRLENGIKERAGYQAELTRLATTNKRARRLLVRQNLADRGRVVLQALLYQYERDARNTIENQVNMILDRAAHKNYKMEIAENFGISLFFSDGQRAPKSGGENQLMSLAFIAALVKFAISRVNDKSGILIPGTVAPLVLDSPFGQLDPAYRVSTAKFVPEMAEQVVLLVSGSQGDAEVLDALAPCIGAEYVLISENKGARGLKDEQFLVRNGRQIKTTIFNCERNRTLIERLS